MRRTIVAAAGLVALALAVLPGLPVIETGSVVIAQGKAGPKPALPLFEVDYKFPTLPGRMLLGGVGGATADSHGNVWVFHRPHTLEEGNATENGFVPAPPVVAYCAPAP